MGKAEEIKECLERVNMYRNVHGSDDLELDKKLCSKAQDWAEKLAKKDGLEHASKDDRGDSGENIAGHTGTQPITQSIDRWYAEEKDYDYKNAKFSGNTGHFTQIVWKASKKFGIGWATSKTGWTYVVSRYSPAGNVIITPPGEEECFRENVQRPDRTLQRTFQTMKITQDIIEPKPFQSVNSTDRSSFVSKINEIRRNHKVNPVVEDKALNTAAQKWAEEIARKDKAENGPEDDQGECLFSYSGPNFDLNSAITAWYKGAEKYDFKKSKWQQGCGNFTQLVWADSTHVGVGAAESKESKKVYVVARFTPPGNLVITPPGEEATFKKNVFPA